MKRRDLLLGTAGLLFAPGLMARTSRPDVETAAAALTLIKDGTSNPIAITSKFFGMHVHRYPVGASTEPTISYGSVRSHDYQPTSGDSANKSLRWHDLEPTDGNFDWTNFDAWVAEHYTAGRDMVFTLGFPASWASARAAEAGPYGNGTGAEPTNNSDWTSFCSAVATRAAGKIKYWEIWNEPNYGTAGAFFTGTAAKLAELTRLANTTIKAIDPTAKILVGGFRGVSNANDLNDFLTASDNDGGTGADWLDIITWHGYCPTTGLMLGHSATKTMVDAIRTVMSNNSISSMELWDGESAPAIIDKLPSGPNLRRESAIYHWIASRIAFGFNRAFFYAFDNVNSGMRTTDGTTDDPWMQYAWDYMYDLLVGKTVYAKVYSNGTAFNSTIGTLIYESGTNQLLFGYVDYDSKYGQTIKAATNSRTDAGIRTIVP